MIRIFGHYVSSKTGLLVIMEAMVLAIAAYAGLSFQSAINGAQPHLSLAVIGYPLAMLLLVSGMGLYQSNLWEQISAVRKRTLMLLVGGFLIAILLANLTTGNRELADTLSIVL